MGMKDQGLFTRSLGHSGERLFCREGGKQSRLRWTVNLERPYTVPARIIFASPFYWGKVWIAKTRVSIAVSPTVRPSLTAGFLFFSFAHAPQWDPLTQLLSLLLGQYLQRVSW